MRPPRATLRHRRQPVLAGHLARQAEQRAAHGRLLARRHRAAVRLGRRQRRAADQPDRAVRQRGHRPAHRGAQPGGHGHAGHRPRLRQRYSRHRLRPQDQHREVHRLHRRRQPRDGPHDGRVHRHTAWRPRPCRRGHGPQRVVAGHRAPRGLRRSPEPLSRPGARRLAAGRLDRAERLRSDTEV